MRLLFALLLFASMPLSEALAWGAIGHSIVAEIAQRRLTPQASDAIAELLGRNISLASISSWADDYKFLPGGAKTKRWHYVDIDIDDTQGALQSPCEMQAEGDCLNKALAREIALLRAPDVSAPARAAALKFVVHLMGDLTQPLHCSERKGDGGGNALMVDFVGDGPDGKPLLGPDKKPLHQIMAFHALFDDGLINAHTYSWGAYLDELETSVVPGLSPGDVNGAYLDDWKNECHDAGKRVYALLPEDGTVPLPLDNKFQKSVQSLIDHQLAIAGLRLAAVLNQAFAK